MDIKEALNTIAEMCNALNLNPNSKQGQAMLMAISALKESNRENRSNGEWIPVSERLPKDDQRVNITIQNNYTVYVTTATWDEKIGYFYNLGHAFDDVVAWRELPEPYKAEKGE